MANLSPDMIQQLISSGQLSPETAQRFSPAPASTIAPVQPPAAPVDAPPVEPALAAPMPQEPIAPNSPMAPAPAPALTAPAPMTNPASDIMTNTLGVPVDPVQGSTPEQIFESRVQDGLFNARQNTGLPDALLRKDVEKKVLDEMAAEKLSADKHAQIEAHNAQIAKQQQLVSEKSAYESELASVNAENEKRNLAGLAPKPVPEMPASLKPADIQDIQQAQLPTKEEVETIAAPLRQVAAKQAAHTQVQTETAVKQQQQAENVDAKAQQAVDEYEPKSISEIMKNGTTSQKWGAILGVMLGAAGGGITGKGNNAYIDMIEADIKRHQEKQKLTAQQAAAQSEALFKKAELELKAKAEKNNTRIDDAKLQVALGELQIKQQEARQKQTMAMMLEAGRINNPELFPKEVRERLIRLPDGSYAPVRSPKVADDLDKSTSGALSAVSSLQRIKDLALNGSTLDPRVRASLQSELRLMVGNVKEQIVGPGSITKEEYARIETALGDPTKIFALTSLELIKLDNAMRKLKRDVKTQYKQQGIAYNFGPDDVTREKAEQYLQQKHGYSPVAAEKAVDKLMQKK